MPGTVDDFMRRFGGGGALDDREAEQYYDRFATTHPDDREFDTETMAQGTTEYLGQLPDEHFEEAAHTAFAQAPPAQRQGWLSNVLGALQGRGVDLGGLQSQLGLPSLSPNEMGPDAYARVANKYPPAKPEVLRWLAPQRGLIAIAKSKPKTEQTGHCRLPELSNFGSPPAEPGVYHD